MTTRTFQNQFPDYDRTSLPEVYGLVDESWGNDTCPVMRGNGLELWIDYADASKREIPETPAFCLKPEHDLPAIAYSDDFAVVARAYIDTMLAPMLDDVVKRVWLGAAYKHAVGYDPFEDHPANTVEEVSELLAGVLAESVKAAVKDADDGCPKGDPGCHSGEGDCHDTCERPAAESAPVVSQITNIFQKIRLAREFGSLIQGYLSVTDFRAVCDANKTYGDDDGICATHEHMDANMVMLEAFKNVFGRDPLEPGGMTEEDTLTWNDAWAIAKAAEFFA